MRVGVGRGGDWGGVKGLGKGRGERGTGGGGLSVSR